MQAFVCLHVHHPQPIPTMVATAQHTTKDAVLIRYTVGVPGSLSLTVIKSKSPGYVGPRQNVLPQTCTDIVGCFAHSQWLTESPGGAYATMLLVQVQSGFPQEFHVAPAFSFTHLQTSCLASNLAFSHRTARTLALKPKVVFSWEP